MRTKALLLAWALCPLCIAIAEPTAIIGCNFGDHEECDELCKRANWLYGHCRHLDQSSLKCQCYPYKLPQDGAVCTRELHDACDEKCIAGGEPAGGYCYPHTNGVNDPSLPRCSCFHRTKDSSS
ncbi:hypothetical protein T4B_1736 [Trichinella pseudospiralis]|nr:hypothetical protein T4E_11733 [Trichinella pseudospiralis]KRY67693.1 hypothetical protein T4A_8467 [Trichinella pseudospiralis]KRZ20756.1 hypothetical protein T4B_1736 [Trichinella pseudospiralis]KRZ38340.1 hypothetical protein T4C_533 [Trichinella pseudospiralis]